MPRKLTIAQKWQAVLSLAPATVKEREGVKGHNRYYVSHPGVSVKEGNFLTSAYGKGRTKLAAMADHFRELTELKPTEVLVVDKYSVGLVPPGGDIRRLRLWWNGFMWAEV